MATQQKATGRRLSGDVFTTDPNGGAQVVLARGSVPPDRFAEFLADKPHLFEEPEDTTLARSAGPRVIDGPDQ